MVIGGRNFSGDGTPASLSISIDGRGIGQYTVVPGFFLRLMTVAPGMLAGAGDYGALTIETHGDVAIEQFDCTAARSRRVRLRRGLARARVRRSNREALALDERAW